MNNSKKVSDGSKKVLKSKDLVVSISKDVDYNYCNNPDLTLNMKIWKISLQPVCVLSAQGYWKKCPSATQWNLLPFRLILRQKKTKNKNTTILGFGRWCDNDVSFGQSNAIFSPLSSSVNAKLTGFWLQLHIHRSTQEKSESTVKTVSQKGYFPHILNCECKVTLEKHTQPYGTNTSRNYIIKL